MANLPCPDNSPPGCVGVTPVLGQGLRVSFQSSRTDLLMSKLRDAGMEDKETGIKNVSYSLLDVASVDGGAVLAAPLSLPWLDHDGLPLTQKMGIQGISLLHGHTYSVNISLLNYIGLGGSCLTTKVTIDATPPTEGVVLLLQHDKDNEAVMPIVNHFQYSLQVLRIANRLFSDAESGILGFMVTVYRTDGWLIQPEVRS